MLIARLTGCACAGRWEGAWEGGRGGAATQFNARSETRRQGFQVHGTDEEEVDRESVSAVGGLEEAAIHDVALR